MLYPSYLVNIMTIKISIKNSDRVAFIGTSGSGKTVLAKYYLQFLNRVVVIDPKHTFKLDGFKRAWRIPFMARSFKLVVRPKMNDDEKLLELIQVLYKMRNVTIYVDELATLNDTFPLSTAALANVARTGRELKVALWTATQRPRGVPRIFMTESETFFIFNLRAEEDRAYVAGYAGNEVQERIMNREFWYVRTDAERPDLLTLDLDNNRIVEIPIERMV